MKKWIRSIIARGLITTAVSLLAAPGLMAAAPPASERHPGDGEGAYKTHQYQDLFAAQLGHSHAETHAKIASAFQQLFHGDGQEQRVYFETGANANGTLAYITN
jgi:oligosaccharide reducing-end xylanase